MDRDWISIDDVKEIPSTVTSIPCNTRNFHVLLSTDKITKENQAYELIHRRGWNVCLLEEGESVISWLKGLETMSGGKAEWRCLNFKGVPTKTGWLKYIRMFRIDEKMFIVCNDDLEPINTMDCVEDNLEKKFLNTH